MATSQKKVSEGVTVTKETPNPRKQVLSASNDRELPISITLDITGSTNVTIEQNPGNLTFSIVVPAKETLVLATLLLEDDWQLTVKYRVSLKQGYSGSFMRQIAEEEEKRWEGIAASCRLIMNATPLNEDFTTALQRRNIEFFVDPYFPPGSESIYRGAEQTRRRDMVVHWRRPKQFFSGSYAVFHENIEPSDVKQGLLGDCWLFRALSALAERPELVRRLFLTTDANEAGIYRLRICKDGEWRVVTVDDFFPCYPNSTPIFGRSKGNELWVMLLEKAYAKLVGSYLLLNRGWAHEAMSDFTGGPTQTYEFENTPDKDDLWRKIVAMDTRGALISTATPGQDMWTESRGLVHRHGIVSGHAYTIIYTVISAREVRGHRLLNIRNPWGEFEWSDRSALWAEEMKEGLNPVLDENDGTIWMSYEDVLKYFVNVSFCLPDSFYEARLKGKLLRTMTTDGRSLCLSECYYCIRLAEKSRVFIGVHQDDKRSVGVLSRRGQLDLSVLVFQRDSAQVPHLYHYEPMKVEKSVEFELELEPGEYIIVPRSSGCALSRPASAIPENRPLLEGSKLSALAESTFRDIFRKFDMMMSQYLNNDELRAVFQTGGISEGDFQQYRQAKDLTCEGFVDLMEKVTLQRGENFMFEFLEKHGYDRDLYSVKSRVLMVTIHSEKQVELEVRDNTSSNLANIGLAEHIKAHGEVKHKSEIGELYSFRERYFESMIGTYMVRNKHSRAIKATVDVTSCVNSVVSTLTNVNEMTLEPGSAGILLHYQLLPESIFKPSFLMKPI